MPQTNALPQDVLAESSVRDWIILLKPRVLTLVVFTGLVGLLVALTIFFPASGAFVSLTQSALMDFDPGRQPQHMARWTLAGSVGAVLGPLLVAAVLAAGGNWRLAFIVGSGPERRLRLAALEDDSVRLEPVDLGVAGEGLTALAASPDGKVLYYVQSRQVHEVPAREAVTARGGGRM